jgi:PAS domain S-box-containing protein
VRQSLRGPSIFESRTLVMLLGAATPLLVNIIYIFWFVPIIRLDPTPFAMMISGVLYGWGLFRLGLFNLLPVAGEVVLEGMQEGVMILDQSNRVVYLNPAFSEYSGVSGKDAIGTSAAQVLARWPELVNEFRDTTQASSQITVQLAGDTLRRFEMRISPLRDRGRRFIGRAFILRETASPVGTREVDLTSATARRNLMLMTTKANGDIIAVNDRFIGVLGYSRTEIIEKSSMSIWGSFEQRSSLLRKSHTEGFENMDLDLVAKDGQRVNLICSAKPITVDSETYLFFAMRENR